MDWGLGWLKDNNIVLEHYRLVNIVSVKCYPQRHSLVMFPFSDVWYTWNSFIVASFESKFLFSYCLDKTSVSFSHHHIFLVMQSRLSGLFDWKSKEVLRFCGHTLYIPPFHLYHLWMVAFLNDVVYWACSDVFTGWISVHQTWTVRNFYNMIVFKYLSAWHSNCKNHFFMCVIC